MKRIENEGEKMLIGFIATLVVLLSVPTVIGGMWLGYVSTKLAITWVSVLFVLYMFDEAN